MIITDEKQLRLPCEIVKPEEVDYLRQELEKELEATQKYRSGIGLAAPQIGIQKRMAIVRLAYGPALYKIDLINCVISKGYDAILSKNEGCLSVPGVAVDITRYNEIYVINNLVKPFSFIATGALAIVCQHELDHLNGKLIVDYQNKGK